MWTYEMQDRVAVGRPSVIAGSRWWLSGVAGLRLHGEVARYHDLGCW